MSFKENINMKEMNRNFKIYWYNPFIDKTGYAEYVTINKEIAIKYFYEKFDTTYRILYIE